MIEVRTETVVNLSPRQAGRSLANSSAKDQSAFFGQFCRELKKRNPIQIDIGLSWIADDIHHEEFDDVLDVIERFLTELVEARNASEE